MGDGILQTDALAAFVIGVIVGVSACYWLMREGRALASVPSGSTRAQIITQARGLGFVDGSDRGVPVDVGHTGRVYHSFITPDRMPVSPQSIVEFRVTGLDGPRGITMKRWELRRFMELPTPARSEWTGDKARYGELRELALVMGWVTLDGAQRVRWAPGWQSLGRRVMALADRHDVRL